MRTNEDIRSESMAHTVLDHGWVALKDSMPHWDAHMERTSEPAHWGPGDQRVVEAARISTGVFGSDPGRTVEQDEKLIRYLLANRHTSPLEQVRLTFVAKMPIFVARQWIRHRTGSFNEVSARYSQLPCEFYVPEAGRMQAQATKNKQGSADPLPRRKANDMRRRIRAASLAAYAEYESMLKRGLARELARMVLPTNFYTKWYWTTDLHNFSHFCRLRLHEHAQHEIRVYARAMIHMACAVAPFTVGLLREELGA